MNAAIEKTSVIILSKEFLNYTTSDCFDNLFAFLRLDLEKFCQDILTHRHSNKQKKTSDIYS